MTGLLIAIALAAALLALTWRFARLDRGALTLLAAALAIGLAGYAWQGRPGLPGKPDTASTAQRPDSFFEKERFRWFTAVGLEGQWLTFADALIRQGATQSAVTAIRSGLRENPKSVALWTGLGNALTAHAEGLVTPAAQLAFDRAAALDPANPAPRLFLGEALLRSGQIDAAEAVWKRLLASAPADAPWRGEIEMRLFVTAKLREAMTARK
ncbi:tetratricopeptide repeat protein [Sphingomonas sp. ID0503]|uniref:tetratricopeptide repeat protein n=1 Tax=Sphingomonas sp. ID0503 TaxID=3399691 RepID=UPI003AFA5568